MKLISVSVSLSLLAKAGYLADSRWLRGIPLKDRVAVVVCLGQSFGDEAEISGDLDSV